MKLIIKFLAFIICFLLLVSCGKKETDNTDVGTKPNQSQSQEKEKQEEPEVVIPTSIHKERVIVVDGMKNVRELGGLVTTDGKTIKKGLVFRASELSGTNANITELGKNTLLQTYKIKTELDLRSETEAAKNGAIPTVGELGSGVKYIHHSAKSYYDFVLAKTNEGEILKVFADYDNYPILFHCVYGADRTGTVAYILEALVGVSYEDIVADYELTGWRDRDYSPFMALDSVGFEKKLAGNTWQEKAHYFCGQMCGLTEMEISNIKNIFLTDSAVFRADSLTKPFSVSGNSAVYHLNMRNSKAVKSVTYNGSAVNFNLSGETLTISGTNFQSSGLGVITFDDGATLSFGV